MRSTHDNGRHDNPQLNLRLSQGSLRTRKYLTTSRLSRKSFQDIAEKKKVNEYFVQQLDSYVVN